MKHNFPTDVSIVCTHIHNLKEGKEILHLAVDGECPVYGDVLKTIVNKKYPRFYWDGDENSLCQTSARIGYKGYIWVSLEEFKAFLQGKSKYKTPFKQELKLNSSYTATVSKDNVKVGCQSFTHDVVKKLYQLSLKAQKS